LTGVNSRTRRKTCPSATLSTTNPTWIDPDLRGEKPATNNLSHGTALSSLTSADLPIYGYLLKRNVVNGHSLFSLFLIYLTPFISYSSPVKHPCTYFAVGCACLYDVPSQIKSRKHSSLTVKLLVYDKTNFQIYDFLSVLCFSFLFLVKMFV
jgi:hypothetical protein